MHTLREHRLHAAQYAGGISAEPIYRLALSLSQKEEMGTSLLEYGSGQGHFVRQLLASGYGGKITCTDLVPRPADLSETIGWMEADLNDPLTLPDQSFDTIVCMEVIFHLENPRFLFREFARLLKAGGLLLLTAPNLESLRSYAGLVLGEHFAAFRGIAYPALITPVLREDFRHICLETGFAPPEFQYTDEGLVPKLHVSWQRLSLGLLRGRLFSDNLALLTRKK